MSLFKALRVGHFVVKGFANRVGVIRLSSYNVLPNESYPRVMDPPCELSAENGSKFYGQKPPIINPPKVHIWVVCNYRPFIQIRENGKQY